MLRRFRSGRATASSAVSCRKLPAATSFIGTLTFGLKIKPGCPILPIFCERVDPLSSTQREVHVDLRIDFDRLVVQQVRTILPLLYSLNGGRRQHRMSPDYVQVVHGAIFADDGLQYDRTLYPRLHR